jgi:hypothetical protein
MLEESAILQFLLGGWVSENSRCLTVFVVVFCDFILLASAFSQSNMFSYHFTAHRCAKSQPQQAVAVRVSPHLARHLVRVLSHVCLSFTHADVVLSSEDTLWTVGVGAGYSSPQLWTREKAVWKWEPRGSVVTLNPIGELLHIKTTEGTFLAPVGESFVYERRIEERLERVTPCFVFEKTMASDAYTSLHIQSNSRHSLPFVIM